MNLEDARQHYYQFTGSLSSVNRQLCFAGIAVVWIFAIKDENGRYLLEDNLLWPLGLFVLGLAFDLTHYATASLAWGVYHRRQEKNGVHDDENFRAPKYINWLPLGCIFAKVVATIIGYLLLLTIIYKMLL